MALNDVVSDELLRVQEELDAEAAEDQADVDAKRWRMKYKYKYYYKYKARAEEEAGMQQNQVLGNLWDIDPAVADMELALAAADVDARRNAAGGSPVKALTGGAEATPMMIMASPPQLGRGDELVGVGGESPVGLGEKGQVEFVIYTEELTQESVQHIAGQSKRQAEHFLKILHSTSLQDKAFRAQTVPQQRGMKKETAAWNSLLNIMQVKGDDEVKNALSAREVPAVTSENVRPAVQFLSRALGLPECKESAPTPAATPAGAEKPPWDHSKTPEGRYRYLRRNKESEVVNEIKSNPAYKSPEKIGWDHDKYYKTTGVPNPATCLARW